MTSEKGPDDIDEKFSELRFLALAEILVKFLDKVEKDRYEMILLVHDRYSGDPHKNYFFDNFADISLQIDTIKAVVLGLEELHREDSANADH